MYSRDTELRHLDPIHIYRLSVKLDDNDCWKTLMGAIPKKLSRNSIDGTIDWEKATASGTKYNNDHLRQIENAIRRHGESRLYSQILFDEWSTSGDKSERPTVGTLLQLLVRLQLFRAADYVAEDFLNEPKPERPSQGPGKAFPTTIPDEVFRDIQDVVHDTSYYPSTELLQNNANCAQSVVDNNKDFYTKYHENKCKVTNNEICDVPALPPKAPPRRIRKQPLQQLHQSIESTSITAEAFNNMKWPNQQQSTTINLPKLSELMDHASTSTDSTTKNAHILTQSTNLSEAPIPELSLLGRSTVTSLSTATTSDTNLDTESFTTNTYDSLPVLSIFNGKNEHSNTNVGSIVNSESFTTNTFDSLPVLSIFNDKHEQSNTNRVSIDAGLNCNKASHSSCSGNFNSELSSDNLPAVLMASQIDNSKKSMQLSEDFIDDDDDDDFEDDNYVNDDSDDDNENSSKPNLFDQNSSNNDSSLTNVTGTSGENSFELSMHDSNVASNESLPCLSALKP